MEIQNGEQLLALMRGFQVPCVLAAAADLDVFNLLEASPLSSAEAAGVAEFPFLRKGGRRRSGR